MIDLAELREVLEGARDYFWRRDAWGVPAIWMRGPSGEPHIVSNLDDRHPEDRMLMWSFDHLPEVLAELETVREVTST